MPRRSDGVYFLLICTEAEFQRHLAVCRNSEFSVQEDAATGGLTVRDRHIALLRAERGAMGWLVFLHRKYYRHPFKPGGSGNALPGAS